VAEDLEIIAATLDLAVGEPYLEMILFILLTYYIIWKD